MTLTDAVCQRKRRGGREMLLLSRATETDRALLCDAKYRCKVANSYGYYNFFVRMD